MVIGKSLPGPGAGVSLAMAASVFLSNVPERLSSAAGMRRAGRSPYDIFGLWGWIALASGLAALIGNLAGAGLEVIAAVTALEAGAVLAMIVDTIIP